MILKVICCERNVAFIQKHGGLIILYLNVLLTYFPYSCMFAGEERDVGGHLQDIKSFRSFQWVPCTDKTLFQLARKQDERKGGKFIVKNSFLTSFQSLLSSPRKG